jgi:hypothetical protein
MRLLYSGSSECDQPTFKRLLVVADEVSFLDRPSVMFGNWGTIARPSFFRRFSSEGSPVGLSVFAPPSGPVTRLFQEYIQADLQNLDFIRTFVEGLKKSDSFTVKLIQLDSNYSTGSGSDVRAALINDPTLLVPMDSNVEIEHPENFFDVRTPEGRRDTFKSLLIEESINVTNALIMSEHTGTLPVSDDPFFARLLAMRSTDSSYVGEVSRLAPFVGYEIAKSVIPDEALQQLTIPQILKYREKTKDAYSAWSTEINRISSRIDQLDPEHLQDEIQRLIATDLAPQMVDLQREMSSVRDALFGDVVKNIISGAKWQVPALTLAYFSHYGVAGSISLFASKLLQVAPAIVDYIQARRDVARRHAMSYLIGLANN